MRLLSLQNPNKFPSHVQIFQMYTSQRQMHRATPDSSGSIQTRRTSSLLQFAKAIFQEKARFSVIPSTAIHYTSVLQIPLPHLQALRILHTASILLVNQSSPVGYLKNVQFYHHRRNNCS